MWHEEHLLIDGRLVPASGGATYENENPATEKILGVAADASIGDANAAVAAARRAFDTTDWSTNHDFRAACLRQLHSALEKHKEDMRTITIAEVGAPHRLTDGPQLQVPIDTVLWTTELLERYDFTEQLGVSEAYGGANNRWIEREPIGVVAAITPYNYPTQINLAKMVPALAAGCTVVLKGSPDTPWSALALGRLIADETDIPAGVVNVLTSSSAEVGEALTNHPDVDMITFTGSTPVGRAIMAAAAPTLKKVFLELGGKSANVVLDDADLNTAVLMGTAMICSHAGQGCAITTRLLVPASKHDECVEIAKQMLPLMPFGEPTDESTLAGPLINAKQLAKVERMVNTAVEEGATVLVGGKRSERFDKGYYYEPTILIGVGEDDSIAQEEVFGPVLAIIPYDDDDDAIRIANNSIFGLSGAVSGTDPDRVRKVAKGIRAGTMSINGGVYYGPDAPFGGYKQSGIGREMGVAGFEEFLEIKTMAEPAPEAGS